MIPTAQGLLLNQVIITYFTYSSFVSSACSLRENVCIMLYYMKYFNVLITTACVHLYYQTKLLHASYICHIWYIGVAVNWTCHCTAATRRCPTNTKDASKRPTANTHCTGDGHSFIMHFHNHRLLNFFNIKTIMHFLLNIGFFNIFVYCYKLLYNYRNIFIY